MVDDIVNTAEMIYCLYYVIHIHSAISNTNRISFKNISSLIVRKLATFYMIRVIFYSIGKFLRQLSLQIYNFLPIPARKSKYLT